MSKNRERAARLLEAFADHAERAIARRLKVDPSTAASLGREIAEAVRTDFAGQQIYILARPGDATARDRAIVAAARAGRDIGEIATEYGIAMQTVYKIIRTYERTERARAQADLFPGKPENP